MQSLAHSLERSVPDQCSVFPDEVATQGDAVSCGVNMDFSGM